MASSQPDVEWDEQQQAWMLALADWRASRCPCGCGLDVDDTTAPEGSVRFRVPPPARCLARDALSMAQAANHNPRPEALLWRVDRR